MVAIIASWGRVADGRIMLVVPKEGAENLVAKQGYPSSAEALIHVYDKNKILVELIPKTEKK